MAHDIKLILSDIDGTLVAYGQERASARALAAFHAALDAGMRVGPASGRALPHVLPAFGDPACVATALATNGMQVYLDGELIHTEYLDAVALEQVVALVSDMPQAGVIYFDADIPHLVCGSREILRQSFPVYAAQALDAPGLPAKPLVKVNVFVAGGIPETAEVLHALEAGVDGIAFNLPMAGFVNLTPPGYSKASGISLLCERLGIGLDQVVVFGDGGNDVEMLAHVPNGVAVAGAVPEAAEAARWHIGPVEDDAVAAAIEQLAAGVWPFAE